MIAVLMVAVFLSSSSGRDTEDFENEIHDLRYAISLLQNKIGVLEDEIAAQRSAVIGMESEGQQAHLAAEGEVMQSLMEELDRAALLLGVESSLLTEGSIALYGNFAVVESLLRAELAGFSNSSESIRVVLEHREMWNDEMRWWLLYYEVGFISGSAFSPFGNWEAALANENRFDESFEIRLYRFDNVQEGQFVGEYFVKTIEPENWQKQIVCYMQAYMGVGLSGLWYEGDRLFVNLTPATANRVSYGSTAAITLQAMLLISMATLPGVSEIEVLVGGQRGFSFVHA